MKDNLEIFIEKHYLKKVILQKILIALLESRLDTVIYRAKFATDSFFSKTND